MKKILAVVMAVLLMLTAGTVGVFAARGNKGAGFVDENNDGICDNQGKNVSFVDSDGDGACDNGIQSPGYIDDDGDGICDNRIVSEGNPETGKKRNPRCQGAGFTDENADGVCDNSEADGSCKGLCKAEGKDMSGSPCHGEGKGFKDRGCRGKGICRQEK